MGAAIGDVLGLAAGVAVSQLPIVAMILLLGVLALLLAARQCRGRAGGQDPRHLEDVGRRPQRRCHGRAVRGIRIQACR
jgi:hypothetical protein